MAQTLEDVWGKSKHFGIPDSSIVEQLQHIYLSLFEKYPVKGVNMEHIWKTEEYIDLYLNSLSWIADSINNGRRFSRYATPVKLDDIKDQISPNVYKQLTLKNTMSSMIGLQLNSSVQAKEFIKENEDILNTEYGDLMMNGLPRSELFDSLSKRKLDSSIVFLDEPAPIDNIDQLINRLGNKAMLLDFWGTWCGSCRNQFKYNNTLKPFLEKKGIEMVYVSKEYTTSRADWKKVIAAYDLKGKHFIVNNHFENDLKNKNAAIVQYPTYMLITPNGELITLKDIYPQHGKKFNKHIEELLK